MAADTDPHLTELRERLDRAEEPERPALCWELAWECVRAGHTDEAEAALDRLGAGLDTGDDARRRARVVRLAAAVRRGRLPDTPFDDVVRDLELDRLDAVWAGRATCALGEIGYQRGHVSRLGPLFERARERLEAEPPSRTRDGVRAAVFANLGRYHAMRHELASGLTAFEAAVEACRATADDRHLAQTLVGLGNLCSDTGRYDRSLAAYREALGIARRRADPIATANALHNLAVVLYKMGRERDALEATAESLSLSVGSEVQSKARELRAWSWMRLGDVDEAIREAEEAVAISSERGHPTWHAGALTTLGAVRLEAGDVDAAADAYRRAGEAAAPSEEARRNPRRNLGLARIAELRGDLEAAIELVAEACDIVDAAGDRHLQVETRRAASRLAEHAGRFEEALAHHRLLTEIQHELTGAESLGRIEHLWMSHRLDEARRRELDLERDVAAASAEVASIQATLERESEQRRQLEAERRDLEHQLRESQRVEAVGRVAGGVAHDFNNLLTVVRGYADQLRLRADLDDRDRTAVDEILAASERGAKLTRQMLAYCRRQPAETRTFDVNGLVTGLAGMIGPLVRGTVAVEIALDDDAGLVNADPHQIEQVVVNLALNARDAMPKGGTLRIATGRATLDRPDASIDAVRIAVADTGCGIPDAMKPFVLDPFFTTKPRGRGTGLGLSTAFGIARQFGGDLRFRSTVGEGSEFEVLLPRASRDAAEGDPAGSPSTDDRSSARVLLVEDDDAIRQLFSRQLSALGYAITAAEDGGRAIEIATSARLPFEVVVSDVVLPRVGGLDLRARLADADPDLRFVMTSGYVDPAIDPADLGPGTTFLAKPFTVDRLDDAIQEVLRR